MKNSLHNPQCRRVAGLMSVMTMLALLVVQAQTKDTVYVPSDISSQGNLNTAVQSAIGSGKLSETVFKLEPNGYYILTGTITTPQGSHLTIVGPEPGITQQTAPPQIVWTSSGGVTQTINFNCYGDVTMKNIWILSANTNGVQIGTSIVIEDDTSANLSGKGERLEMDGCIIDYMNIGNSGGAIEPACQHFRAKITNTYFRNMTDPHFRYYGRAVSWTYQSTLWHTDTLIFENCTMANCGYAYSQQAPEYADYVSFNHCTFVNTMMYSLESPYWWWLSVTNCLFVNSFMFGDIPSGDAANMTHNGGAITIDSVSNFGFSVPFTDSKAAEMSLQRHILFANNSYSHEQWYINFLNANPYNPTRDIDKIHRMPMMNKKTYWFLTSKTGDSKNFPYMNMVDIYPPVDTTADLPATYNASVDPQFILNPVNSDSIEAFLLGRWLTGENVNWAYNPQEDIQQVWPMSENLAYTNAALNNAGMSGYPLGDLYHWWPAQYASWKTQAADEHQNILGMLTNGVSDLGVPATVFPVDNAQNQRADTLVMKWNSVLDALSYRCQLSLNPSFSTLIASDLTTDTTFTVTALHTSTKYYWRVRAYSSDGPGLFSSAASFTTFWVTPAVPALLSPVSNAINQPTKVKLICSKAADAAQYHWQVSTNSAFSTFAVNDSTTDTSFTSKTLIAGSKYYWRVRGVNGGFAGSYTSADSFTVMAAPEIPLLVFPESNQLNLARKTKFTWQPSSNAVKYRLQVAENQNFAFSAIDTMVVDTFMIASAPLSASTLYFWHVKAIGLAGESSFSAARIFATGTTLDVSEADALPKQFALFQNYPNPFNPVTQIKYSVPRSSHVSLKVYNLLGEGVATLFEGVQQPGNFVATFNGTGRASGLYLYRLQADKFVETKKLILLK